MINNNNIESRVVKLETVVDVHAQELRELRSASEALTNSLSSIQHNLQQIKYVSLGGLFGLFSQEMGLLNLLKNLLH